MTATPSSYPQVEYNNGDGGLKGRMLGRKDEGGPTAWQPAGGFLWQHMAAIVEAVVEAVVEGGDDGVGWCELEGRKRRRQMCKCLEINDRAAAAAGDGAS